MSERRGKPIKSDWQKEVVMFPLDSVKMGMRTVPYITSSSAQLTHFCTADSYNAINT